VGADLFQSRLIVLDTETTGFPEFAWSRVVELAAIVIDPSGAVVSEFVQLVRPEIHDGRAASAEKVHGLTREMLKDQPLAGEVAEAFLSWSSDYLEPGDRMTSYNVAFDRPMLERMGLDRLRWGPCIMEQAMELLGPMGVLRTADPSHPRYTPGKKWLWPSLADAAKHLDVQVEGVAHRALTDVHTAAKVLAAIYRRRAAAAVQQAESMTLE
jgi:DNA polymerase-3 subunit epsilon